MPLTVSENRATENPPPSLPSQYKDIANNSKTAITNGPYPNVLV